MVSIRVTSIPQNKKRKDVCFIEFINAISDLENVSGTVLGAGSEISKVGDCKVRQPAYRIWS